MPGSPRRKPVEFVGLDGTGGGDWKIGGAGSVESLNEIKVNLDVAVEGFGSSGRDEFLRRVFILPGFGEMRVIGRSKIGAGGLVAKIDFGGTDSMFFVKVVSSDTESVFEETVGEMDKYAKMNDCGVVKFRSWSKFSDTENTGVVVIVMQALDEDLKDLFNGAERREESGPPQPVLELRMRRKLGEFLLKLLDCLRDHGTSFTDLKPENIGVAGDEFRLIDIDSIGRGVYTVPWNVFGREKYYIEGVDSGFDFLRDTGITKAEFRFNGTIYSALAIGATACSVRDRDPKVNDILNSAKVSVEDKVKQLMEILDKDEVVEMRRLSSEYGTTFLREFIPKLRNHVKGFAFMNGLV